MLKCNNIKSVTEVPYFQGDHWPDRLEELLTEVERKPGRRSERSKKTQEAVQNKNLLRRVRSYFNEHSEVRILLKCICLVFSDKIIFILYIKFYKNTK